MRAGSDFAKGPGPKPGKRNIRIIFLVAGGLLVTSVVFIYQIGLMRVRAEQTMSQQLLVLQHLADFLSLLKDAETGQRGFVLTGEESYLQPYTNVFAKVRSKLDGMSQLASTGVLEKGRVERVVSLTGQKLAELEQTIQVRREKGLEAAAALVREDRGKQLMDDIRAEMRALRTTEEADFADAERNAERAHTLGTITFIGTALLNLLVLGWAFRKISAEVKRRESARLELERQKGLLMTTLASIGDAVIVTDWQGRVTMLNAEAERLTGWNTPGASGRPLPEVFRIVNELTRQPAENPVEKVLRLGTVVGLANHTLLLARDGAETPIDDSAAPIRQGKGPTLGVVLVFRDVTAQKQALKASQHLAAVVQHSGDAIFTKNLSGIIQTWNTSAERLFGYKPEEIIGKPVTALIPPERLSEEDEILNRIRKGEPFERRETVRVAKDGRQIPVLLSVSPLKDSEGEVIGASKIIHDITDVLAAREALAQEKELLATTLASIGDGVIVTDPQGRVTFLNAEAERLTAWKSSDAANKELPEVFRIVNEETRQPVENPVSKVLRHGKVVGLANHTILVSKNGAETPIDDSAAPIRRPNGKLQGVVLVFRDFTEHKAAEREVRELSLFPEQNPAPVLRISNRETLLYANPAALEKLSGWSIVVGEDAPYSVAALAVGSLKSGQTAERELAVADRNYHVTVMPIPHSGYANLYWSDITERKRAEEALREAHHQLSDRAVHLAKLVEERTAKLREMINEMQHVSYAIVHDMRAPLRAMHTFADVLLEQISGPVQSPPELQDYCRRIITAASRLDKLIRDSLDYTKAVLQEVPLRPVDLSKLIPELLETYPNLQPQSAEIIIEGKLPIVLGDESLLTQCFSNLLGNAVKFVTAGGRPRVRIRTQQENGTARISVVDNGIGIPLPAQGRLFGMFQRLNAEYEGTGIGLAIVRKVVERMGGKVGAESEPGRGSCFWVELRVPENSIPHASHLQERTGSASVET